MLRAVSAQHHVMLDTDTQAQQTAVSTVSSTGRTQAASEGHHVVLTTGSRHGLAVQLPARLWQDPTITPGLTSPETERSV